MDGYKLKLLGNELAKKVGQNELYLHQHGDNRMPRIICENEAAKQTVNSFNNNEMRKKSFIVRGLICNGCDEAIDLIQQAVLTMGVTGEIEIGKFETAYQRFHPSDNRIPL